MPKILKLNNVNLKCYTGSEANRIPNLPLCKNMNIYTNNLLLKNKKLSKYVNNETMGALDNYAQHKNLHIYITPLENDLFDDLSVGVYSKTGNKNVEFAMKLNDGKHSVADFLSDLNKKITMAVNKGKRENALRTYKKPSKFEEIKMWFHDTVERVQNSHIEKLQTFAEKHRKDSGIKGLIAESIDEVY